MASRPGLDRTKVLEAAIRIADSVGFEQLTWSQVAEALEVKPPSLYNHVDSLEQLKGLMAVEGVRRLHSVLSHAEGLEAIGRAYVRFGREQPALYQAAIRAPGAEAMELIEWATKTVGLMVASLRSYGFSPDLAIHAVRIFRSALHGFVSIEASGGFGLPQSLDTTLEALLATMIAGLGHLNDKEELR